MSNLLKEVEGLLAETANVLETARAKVARLIETEAPRTENALGVGDVIADETKGGM